MARKKRIWLWLGISAAALLLTAAVLLFVVNQWSVSVGLNGESEMTLECGTSYMEYGAKAVFGGNLFFPSLKPLSVTEEGSVDTTRPGTYRIVYHAEFLRFSAEAERTVHVVDTVPPVIELTKIPGYYTLPGAAYVEEGFTATDNVDGDLTDHVEATEENGVVHYRVADRSGNVATAERTVFYDDPVPPVITLLGEETIELPAGSAFDDPGFTATDNVDGDLTEQVAVSGTVDRYSAGTYEICYTVEDSHHNRAECKRTVIVTQLRQPDVVVPGDKVIYLTFDDGPSQHTQTLLDILEKYNVKATFFVVNYGYAGVIAKEAAAGHSIGVHSATHDYDEIYASEEAFFADQEKMRDIIYAQTGKYTTLMRFPGGSSNTVSRFNPGIMTRLTKAVTDMGFQYFDWNVSSGDAGLTTDSDVVYQNVIDGVRNHNVSIVLMHDSKGYTVAAVERIIIWGLENGYTFLPLTPESPTAHHGLNN